MPPVSSRNGTEQNRIGLATGRQGIGGQRFAAGIDGRAADQMVMLGELVAITLADGMQHIQRCAGDFRADAVASQDCDISMHDGVPRSG
jgi:hypothetical protein